MPDLFNRSWRVIVGIPGDSNNAIDVSSLDLDFKAVSSLKAVPNRCELIIWNLNKDHRSQILKRNIPGQNSGIAVQIEAGYVNNTTIVFSGDMRTASSVREPSDWKTNVSADDGGRAYREGIIKQSFAAGTPISTMVKQCALAMGVGLGNVADFESVAEISGIGSSILGPMTLYGQASQQFDRLMKSVGLTWSIQKGNLQVLAKGTPLQQTAILISPETGLIGSPEAAADATVSLGNPQQFAANAKSKVVNPPKPKDPGILKLKTLLIPGMVPGRKISLYSDAFHGDYMLTEVEYNGSTYGDTWECDCVARKF